MPGNQAGILLNAQNDAAPQPRGSRAAVRRSTHALKYSPPNPATGKLPAVLPDPAATDVLARNARTREPWRSWKLRPPLLPDR
jgi:hypothetical protein